MTITEEEKIFLKELDWEINWDILDDYVLTLPQELKDSDETFQDDWEELLQFDFESVHEKNLSSDSTSTINSEATEGINGKKRKRGNYKSYTMKQPRVKGVWKRGPYRKTRKSIETVL